MQDRFQWDFCDIQIFTSILHIDFQFEITRSLEVHQSRASNIHITLSCEKEQLMRKICSFAVSTNHIAHFIASGRLILILFPRYGWACNTIWIEYRRAEYVLIDLAGRLYFFRRFLVCVCVFLIKFMHRAQNLYI